MIVMTIQTEYNFTLPRGYVDADGKIHREGKMRLATAADEILPMRDPRVMSNSQYLIILILTRVITSLGTLEMVETTVIEKLFVSDLAYLQDLYNRINQMEIPCYEETCPSCGHAVKVPVNTHQATL